MFTLIAMMFSHVALAKTPTPTTPVKAEPTQTEAEKRLAKLDKRWRAVDERAQNTYKIGSWLFTGGVAAGLVGSLDGSAGLAIAGGIAETISKPMMAGASLRSHRALTERGAEVSSLAGYSSWAMFGASIVTSAIGATKQRQERALPYQIGAVGLSLGSVVASGLQHSANARARAELEDPSASIDHTPKRSVALTGFDVTPITGGARVGLSGSF